MIDIYEKASTIPLKNNVEDLRNWMFDLNVCDIDAVLEFLIDRELLNNQGERVAYKFWETYIKEDLEVKHKEYLKSVFIKTHKENINPEEHLKIYLKKICVKWDKEKYIKMVSK